MWLGEKSEEGGELISQRPPHPGIEMVAEQTQDDVFSFVKTCTVLPVVHYIQITCSR